MSPSWMVSLIPHGYLMAYHAPTCVTSQDPGSSSATTMLRNGKFYLTNLWSARRDVGWGEQTYAWFDCRKVGQEDID
jgi:hypothetical protein